MEYLGEEVGNLIDPSATQTSNKQQHAFITALEQAADVRALRDHIILHSSMVYSYICKLIGHGGPSLFRRSSAGPSARPMAKTGRAGAL